VAMFDSYQDYQETYKKQYPYPFMLQATQELKKAEKRYPCALLFGNEATGLDRSFLELGEPLIIPHSPLIDSLNLDNAVSIALYEFSK
ncbi:MAG: TrmH family RNA methyltransferase, partial [Candidatus Enteromonas sp.]